jgi:LAGLIDADG DNA endonuclease family
MIHQIKKPNKTRAFMSNADKLLISNNIPLYFKEIITGMLLSDATLRMNGNMALLGIQQTHFELTNGLWKLCRDLNLVSKEILIINRNNWKTIYSFQTFTLPFFTELFNIWYTILDDKTIKVLPNNIWEYFSPLTLAYFIMGDGSWDSHGSRINLHTNNFTKNEVEII